MDFLRIFMRFLWGYLKTNGIFFEISFGIFGDLNWIFWTFYGDFSDFYGISFGIFEDLNGIFWDSFRTWFWYILGTFYGFYLNFSWNFFWDLVVRWLACLTATNLPRVRIPVRPIIFLQKLLPPQSQDHFCSISWRLSYFNFFLQRVRIEEFSSVKFYRG